MKNATVAEATVTAWNVHHKEGRRVVVVEDSGEIFETTTRSHVWTLEDGTPVANVAGQGWPVRLDRLIPILLVLSLLSPLAAAGQEASGPVVEAEPVACARLTRKERREAALLARIAAETDALIAVMDKALEIMKESCAEVRIEASGTIGRTQSKASGAKASAAAPVQLTVGGEVYTMSSSAARSEGGVFTQIHRPNVCVVPVEAGEGGAP